MTLHTIWGTFHDKDLEVLGRCHRCGKPRYLSSCGNSYPPYWEINGKQANPTGGVIWVCYPCLRPEED
jgi:hypothetical protein